MTSLTQMTHHQIIVYCIVVLGALLAYTGFCRAVIMRKSTQRSIRWALSALTTSSFACAMTGLFDPANLGNAVVATFISMFWVQFVTSRYWYRGVPSAFEKRERRHPELPLVYGVERREVEVRHPQ